MYRPEKIYNMHCHIFPGKIADKAVGAIGEFYGVQMARRGLSDALIADGTAFAEADGAPLGVTRYLVCSTATVGKQVRAINEFIAAETAAHPEFVGFGSLHPDVPDIRAEIDRMLELGLRGIKLHPDFQKFDIDDPALYPMYDYAQGKLPFLFHTGDDRTTFSKPYRLLNVLERFPKMVAIGAHLGGYACWDELDCRVNGVGYLGHPRLYMDTSSTLWAMPPERAVEIIRAHGVERVFFGTDFPMWDHRGEWERFLAMPLTDRERDAILWQNAERFLGIPE